ncbi:fatty acid desaturase [bacterium]|nr:fatty acid desaturase [bacterium]
MISSKESKRATSRPSATDRKGGEERPRKKWSRDDTKGLTAALAIMLSWAASLGLLLTAPLTSIFWYWAIPALLLQTFLYTGLFITAHDAMHGTITPSRPMLNNALGNTAVFLYALFNFKKLTTKHWEHHLHPGDPEQDPDFNNGIEDRFDKWYVRFMMNYLSLPQLIGMGIVFNTLVYLADVPVLNLVLFWVAPALLSTVQLFLFGTYLPHKTPRSGHTNPHHSISNDFPVWLSFLTCYHFGYHLEHHEHPRVPWWRLPAVRFKKVDPGPAFVLPEDPTTPSMS